MKKTARSNPALQAYERGHNAVAAHPIFKPLMKHIRWLHYGQSPSCPLHPKAWLQAQPSEDWNSSVWVNPKLSATPEFWAHATARAALLYGMQLLQPERACWPEWSAACDVVTTRFLAQLKLFATPHMALPELPGWDEERWYQAFCEDGIPAWAQALSLGGPMQTSMAEVFKTALRKPSRWSHAPIQWGELFAQGLSESVTAAVEVAAGLRASLTDASPRTTASQRHSPALQRALHWFVASFPLLGAMVAAFDFIEDAQACRREDIQVAAVNERLRTIWLNPAAALSEKGLRFVIAHEILHVALRHQSRCQGRDPFLWNVACDFVINGWLIEMGVGDPPALGLLHDPDLHGMSAESVYDRIAKDLRRARKLQTLAGSQCDMLERDLGATRAPLTDLDSFYREQLAKGLMLHEQHGRGLLPAGLLEEVRALLQPPIDWQVALAHWFDAQFPPIATHRSWAHMSRRQSATPDIPRARMVIDPALREGRTFGVVLDTSGSMSHALLARALGAIASYAQAKEVPLARLVCCDAEAHDLGYMAPEAIAGRVVLRGRGGTVLQPGIDALEKAADFPASGPILIITDGACDAIRIRREHAFLLPPGARLPFKAQGPVFQMDF